MKTVPISLAIVVSVLFAAAWFHWHPAQAQDKEKPKAPEPVKVPKELLEKRVEAARNVYESKVSRYQAGQGSVTLDWVVWSHRWMDAELALNSALNRPEGDARFKPYHDHLKRLRAVEEIMRAQWKAAIGSKEDVDAATYYRLDAEVLLIQAGGKLP